jgi:hypothetical protein
MPAIATISSGYVASFRDCSALSAPASGLNLKTERALNFSFLETVGKEVELRTPLPVRGCRRCLTLITAGTPVIVFFLEMTVLKPSESSSAVENLGEGTADAASEVSP